MTLRSFQTKMLLWTWGLLLLALAVAFFYSTRVMSREYVRETEERSLRELDSLAWLLESHGPFAREGELDVWMTDLGERLGVRVTYVTGGRVLADSEVPYARIGEMEDHASRPEIVQALESGRGVNIRRSATLNKDMLYVAGKVSGLSGVPDGVVRLAVPFSRVAERIHALRLDFLWIFLGALGAAALTGALLSRNMARSVREFSELARDIGAGGYDKRIRVTPGSEFKPLADSINGMARSIEHHITTIEEQKGRLQAVFDGMCDGVMVLNAEGRIEAFNGALDSMFNLPESALGRTPIEVTRRFEVQDLADSILGGDLPHASAEIDLMDQRTVEVAAVPYFDHQNERKMVLVFHDISALKRSERGLKDFVANASHQLRTPLTSIKGYAETLVDTPPADSDVGREFLETILKNADHMDKVISSMLALAKSEEMGRRLTLSPVSARETLDRALADLAPWAGERGISFGLRVPEGTITVMAEPDGLLHVFHNLMNNAVKYSPDNGVIQINAEDDGESVVFCVEDQGPGISREHSTKVFERFYRVDGNTIDGSGSAGLGLAICRRIVRNFDGDIWHDGYGEDTRGARFCFRLNAPTPDRNL
ncbi:HAMP domain-containing sensor histidine kinase [Pseudodesulfovibrio tunisiensis]|uniref:HAMP domain-containing sensor histidine kinase n=1 Tax=Pseudodesulfovibrio tunisiensis TaxID=463192 RepID=UPI001FB235FB|nr:HAMP domain-containing sensor histidine kinase [Pseudodesulfovibrio tunisiensis]